MSNTEKIKEDLAKKSCYKQIEGIRLLIDDYLLPVEIENLEKSLIRMNNMIYSGQTEDLRIILGVCANKNIRENLIEDLEDWKERENGS